MNPSGHHVKSKSGTIKLSWNAVQKRVPWEPNGELQVLQNKTREAFKDNNLPQKFDFVIEDSNNAAIVSSTEMLQNVYKQCAQAEKYLRLRIVEGKQKKDNVVSKPSAHRWVYIDDFGQNQGPFATEMMIDWYAKGYFDRTRLVHSIFDGDDITKLVLGDFVRVCDLAKPLFVQPISTSNPGANNNNIVNNSSTSSDHQQPIVNVDNAPCLNSSVSSSVDSISGSVEEIKKPATEMELNASNDDADVFSAMPGLITSPNRPQVSSSQPLTQASIEKLGNRLEELVSQLKKTCQVLQQSPNASLVERFETIASSCEAELRELRQLRSDVKTNPVVDVVDEEYDMCVGAKEYLDQCVSEHLLELNKGNKEQTLKQLASFHNQF